MHNLLFVLPIEVLINDIFKWFSGNDFYFLAKTSHDLQELVRELLNEWLKNDKYRYFNTLPAVSVPTLEFKLRYPNQYEFYQRRQLKLEPMSHIESQLDVHFNVYFNEYYIDSVCNVVRHQSAPTAPGGNIEVEVASASYNDLSPIWKFVGINNTATFIEKTAALARCRLLFCQSNLDRVTEKCQGLKALLAQIDLSKNSFFIHNCNIVTPVIFPIYHYKYAVTICITFKNNLRLDMGFGFEQDGDVNDLTFEEVGRLFNSPFEFTAQHEHYFLQRSF